MVPTLFVSTSGNTQRLNSSSPHKRACVQPCIPSQAKPFVNTYSWSTPSTPPTPLACLLSYLAMCSQAAPPAAAPLTPCCATPSYSLGFPHMPLHPPLYPALFPALPLPRCCAAVLSSSPTPLAAPLVPHTSPCLGYPNLTTLSLSPGIHHGLLPPFPWPFLQSLPHTCLFLGYLNLTTNNAFYRVPHPTVAFYSFPASPLLLHTRLFLVYPNPGLTPGTPPLPSPQISPPYLLTNCCPRTTPCGRSLQRSADAGRQSASKQGAARFKLGSYRAASSCWTAPSNLLAATVPS